MNWQAIQVKRLKFIQVYDNVVFIIIRYLAGAAGIVATSILISDLFLPISNSTIGLSLLLLSPCLLMLSFTLFVRYLKDHPAYGIAPEIIKSNPLNSFNFEALEVILSWKEHPSWQYLGETLWKNDADRAILIRLFILPEILEGFESTENISVEQLWQLVNNLVNQTQSTITLYDLVTLFLQHESIKKYLTTQNISSEEAGLVVSYYQQLDTQQHTKQFQPNGGFARGWAVSYTNLLDNYTTAITADIVRRNTFSPLYGRDKIVKEVASQLAKTSKHNVLLMGESGSGKSELFYHLAGTLLTYQTHSSLDGFQVRILHSEQLLNGAGNGQELAKLIEALFAQIIRAKNIVLYIDRIELLLDSTGEVGTADLRAILSDYLLQPQSYIVASATPETYYRLIKPNQTLSESFTVIDVKQPSVNDVPLILLSHVPNLETHYQVIFSFQALKEVTTLAARYIKDETSPQREIDLLEQVASDAATNKTQMIAAKEVDTTLSQKVKVPLQVNQTEQQTLLHLEDHLHQRVIGQDRALKAISDALLRARAGLHSSDRPIGSFLFLGPTGVGKTETAKALAESYFGSESELIRLDMTEYATDQAVEKLLGSNQNSAPGSLTVAIQQHPASVLLLDEIEKASSMVKNLLLQLIDEGRLTTNYGKLLDFTNTIIIATSNAGSEFIRDQILKGNSSEAFERPLIDTLISQQIFLPEFLNRFDGVIVYTPLDSNEMDQVVTLQIQKLSHTLAKEKGITLQISPEIISLLSQKGYDPVFGARALERVLKNDLETTIARQIIAQNLQPGSKLIINSL